ncbi:MAG: phosphoenolpyruvate--protein phosphotransferase [Thermodesulfobacteriota bacterium]
MPEKRKHADFIKGIGVSPGIVISTAYVIKKGMEGEAQYCHLTGEDSIVEIERLKKALEESRRQLQRVKDKMERDGREEEHIQIIDAHLMMMQDSMLVGDTIKIIQEERINAEWALKKVLKRLMDHFNGVDDDYLRERSYDFEHIVSRIISNLSGRHEDNSISGIKEPAIVVAHNLSPADTAQMSKEMVLGFITDLGGKTSHTAIMARALEIPAIVGLETATIKINTGDTVIIDGNTGTVVINPPDSVIAVYRKKEERYADYDRTLHHYRNLSCETRDGRRLSLRGNMELIDDIASLKDHGAEGIGLYRTEFLYMNRRDLPTEEEHYRAYSEVARQVFPHPVIIRTLDIGGDKDLPGLNPSEEPNPALGLRAIRLCLGHRDVFKAQLKGALRSSAEGNVKIMFPMISGVGELRMAKALLDEAKSELQSASVPFNPEIEIGIMIEVPSAAVIADLLVQEVDFISIGTNDLLQYSLAIDRSNEHVAYLYEPYHPAVLRIIKGVAEAAIKAGVDVGVCGEMAGEPEYALILLGFGIQTLSMNAISILKVKRLMRSINYSWAMDICNEISGFATSKEVERYVNERLPEFYSDEFSS